METIAILFMLISANLIYIALSCYYKTKKRRPCKNASYHF